MITTDPRGFLCKVSEPGIGVRGYSFVARDLSEVHEAIDHYYVSENKSHSAARRKCPLCRLIGSGSK
jgi:hypothetical protein